MLLENCEVEIWSILWEDDRKVENFFLQKMQSKIEEKFTFDDVLLAPQFSKVLPRQVDPSSFFTKKIRLQTPLVSAAMDTVTESEMATHMALAGGIGVIHKNLSPQEQASEVARVKRFENGFIFNPEVLAPDAEIAEAFAIRRNLGFKAIPITQNGKGNGKLVGLLTANDFFIDKHARLKVSERMTPRESLLTAQKGISLDDARSILEDSKHSKLLIVDRQDQLFAMVTRRDIEKQRDFPKATLDGQNRLCVAAAVGVGQDLQERANLLVKAGVDALVVDTAHGHSQGVGEAVKFLKKNFPKIEIVAGNVATAEAVEFLAKCGADAVKVGIGPGSICTTRVISGVGMPQLSAIFDCAKVARKLGICIVGDGGARFSGDVAKGLAAGADCIMLGSLLAGTKESPGELIFSNGKTFKVYRGMGSVAAMKSGSAGRYFQDENEEAEKLVPEGVEGQTLFKGSVMTEIFQIAGGLRAAMGYLGARNMVEFHKKAKFVRISNAALQENHPHDVMITNQSPNYRK